MDRNTRNPDLPRGQLVQITQGNLKGYKGTIVNTSDTMVEVHVHSKCYKFSIPLEHIFVIFNETDGIRLEQRNDAPVFMSFEEAAN
jgi:transcription elongation factor